MHPTRLAVLFLAVPASAQQFVRNTTDVPPTTRDTEQVDFADVDLDGDWDAGFANGGDSGNQQNSLWINLGGAQGGTVGVFVDQTSTRCPVVLDQSRDLEFADYDADGDPDVAVANQCTFTNQPSRFWTNQGGAQSGAIGFYVDQTSTRWVGLGVPGSSIPPSQVLAGGGFIEFAHEIDFADFDSDGDLDLIQATWGSAANGTSPTRIFRNDGAGFFTEFNPSGSQLGSLAIPNGSPGLWCEGTQSANTTDSTGVFCDIATSATDADWADVDGDLDIDILLGSRQELPRLFQNRLQENGGVPGFRDVTGASFATNYATGVGHYEQCFGDFDGDDDLDVYGVNWNARGFQFLDTMLRNSGSGFFGELYSVPGSAPDDHTAEPIDYDLDGDLDVHVANFSGQERLVQNGGWSAFTNATAQLPADTTVTLDNDVADVDADGDYDIFCANGFAQPEWYVRNTTAANDVTAPRIARLEQAPARAEGPAPTVVRCHLYDDTPPQLAQWLQPVLEVRVDGGTIVPIPMTSSFAQVFRGEIDGATVGNVEYRVWVMDPYDNASVSPWLSYVSVPVGSAFCSADGTSTPCPCGNDSSAGRGCGNSLGAGARLASTGIASVSSDSLVLEVSPIPNASVLFFQGTSRVNGGAGTVFGDGLRCAGGTVQRIGTKTAAANTARYPEAGDVAVSVKGVIPAFGGVRTYQAWYRNAAAFCTPSTFNLSNGWQIAWIP